METHCDWADGRYDCEPVSHYYASAAPNPDGPTDWIVTEVRLFCAKHAQYSCELGARMVGETYTYSCAPLL